MISNTNLNRLHDLRTNLHYLQHQLLILISWKQSNSVTNFDRITLCGMNGHLKIVLPQHKCPFNIHNEIELMLKDAINDLESEISLITQNL